MTSLPGILSDNYPWQYVQMTNSPSNIEPTIAFWNWAMANGMWLESVQLIESTVYRDVNDEMVRVLRLLG